MKLWLAALALALAVVGGCDSDKPTGSDRTEIRAAQNEPAPDFTRTEVEGSREVIYISSQVALTGYDVKSAEVLQTRDGPAVGVQFTKAGARKFERFTNENKGRRMAILVDGHVAVAPPILMQVAGNKVLIGARLTPERAAALAQALGSPPGE